MKLYNHKLEGVASPAVVLDDMILTKAAPTTAGSRMLEGYRSLFDAEVVSRLIAAGYSIAGKASVGEFAFDLLGESAAGGATVCDGVLRYAPAELLHEDPSLLAAIVDDVNGAPRRAAAQSGLVYLKPTYGTVSRFGLVPVACSGEGVGVLARSVEDCRTVLSVLSGHDDKDGTSLAEGDCRAALEGGECRRVLLPEGWEGDSPEVRAQMASARAALEATGVEVCSLPVPLLAAAGEAWNILMSAELCNNVSRYDGVKFGYRTASFESLDELYTNSRSEAFGKLLKKTILFGSETLSTENYMRVYDKALRVRRLLSLALTSLFSEYGALLLPAVSAPAYRAEEVCRNDTLVFSENRYTAPASLLGLPSVVAEGVALVGPHLADGRLLSLAARLRKGATA